MRYGDRIVAMTRRALDDFFRTARTVPEERQNWKPQETSRSVLEQAMEVALTPLSFAVTLATRVFPPSDEAAGEKIGRQVQSCHTLAEWEQACRDNSEELFAAIRLLSDDDLDGPIAIGQRLPFTSAPTCPLAEIAMFHHDNTVYHTGQINYIQTLYGDDKWHEVSA